MEKRKAWNRINFIGEQEQEIVNLYEREFWTKKRLMKKFNVSQCVIDRTLRDNNAVIRKTKDYRKVIGWSKKINFTEEQKDNIIMLFERDLMAAEEVGRKFKCSTGPIYRVLKEKGIETSTKIRVKKLYISGKIIPKRGKESYSYGREPHNLIKFSEEQEKEIVRLYELDLMNPILISKRFNCESGVIRRILREQGINTSSSHRRRLLVQDKRILVGDKNSRWLGGISFEPYDENFNDKFKRAIRKRDNHECLKCGIHQERLSTALTVHHLNYNKKISIPQNCCSLCLRCNVEVNSNRPHWTKFFQSLLAERYGYKYSETGEIILEVKNE